MRNTTLQDVFAGVGIGLLVGVITGLSVSPVVQTILGALVAGVVTFLGLKVESVPKVDNAKPSSALQSNHVRIAAFSFACVAGILAGIEIRANDLLSPNLKRDVSRWTDAGLAKTDALRVVTYRRVGIDLFHETVMPDTAGSKATPKSDLSSAMAVANRGLDDSVLFAHTSKYCETLSLPQANRSEELNNMLAAGGPLANFAKYIQGLDQAKQASLIDALKEITCAR